MKFNINSSFLYTVQKESYVDEKFTQIFMKERKKDERRAHFLVGKSRVQKALSMKTMTKLQFKENRKKWEKGPR